MTIRRKISIALVLPILALGGFLYLYNQTYLTPGTLTSSQTVLVAKGDNALVVGEKLSNAGVISGKYFLAYYLWKSGQLHDLVAGVYVFSPGIKIPEVARIITGGEIAFTAVPVTFPEGWTAKDMAARLDANGFSGNEFLSIVNNPSQELKDKFPFLRGIPRGGTLEGYLFPDTYFFAKDATSDVIVGKMLNNFEEKITDKMVSDISAQNKNLYDIVTMASIIEMEAGFVDEMKTVGSVFYNRLKIGQRLQSDATLEYVLGDNKVQHTVVETQNQSPYNTYQFAGLPPGPVSNPGINALSAAIYPAESDYYYFLTDLKTKKTIFSKTFDEHVANKAKYGL
ncbi:MAG: hypothetical protein ACD_9C00218G0002 [uncultured bacterium]|nr:MAG: hypothetical protein ACD_9C00218G0002 [uncultured bacterium]